MAPVSSVVVSRRVWMVASAAKAAPVSATNAPKELARAAFPFDIPNVFV